MILFLIGHFRLNFHQLLSYSLSGPGPSILNFEEAMICSKYALHAKGDFHSDSIGPIVILQSMLVSPDLECSGVKLRSLLV